MKKNNKKGFTLVELLAVIVILAILATAAFTLVIPRVEKARKDTFTNEANALVEAAKVYYTDKATSGSSAVSTVTVCTLFSESYASTKGSTDDYGGSITFDTDGKVTSIRIFNKKYQATASNTETLTTVNYSAQTGDQYCGSTGNVTG